MVRATTLKKNAKARAARMNSDQGDGIVATIILPPGHEHVLEELKKVMAGSIMLDRRPETERPLKKEKAVNPFNLAFIANSVAEAFIDCVYEGDLEDAQAMWYLELMQGMHESNENSTAFNILNAVLHYAESPAAPTMNDLYQQLHKDGMVKKFFEAFFDHDDIDDYSLELTILRASVDDTDKLLN